MKIMFYINTLGLGGAERVIANLSEQFAEHGNDVLLVTTFKARKEYPINDKVKRICLELKEHKGNQLIKNITRILSLRRIINKEKPDVLISFMKEANVRAILSTIGLNTKTIVSVRNDPSIEYKGFLGKIIARFIMPFTNGCVFQTGEAMQWFAKKLQNKSCIIINPVNEIFYQTKFVGIRKDIVTTGRLEKQKNHVLLIKAFARIANQIQENLIIYGEGRERDNLEKLIHKLNLKERVFLPGNINNVADTIKNAKIYVLSSDFEGMPNGLMEAMALGLPCISTDCPCGGPKMLLGSCENGLLVPVKDEINLSLSIIKLLKSELLLNKYSQKSLIKALEFNPSIIFDAWVNYIKLINKVN